jgi:hypothetical protein
MKTLAIMILALMLAIPAAGADSTIRDRDGRVIFDKSSNGRDTTYRGADGRTTITERDNTDGSRDYYNADGEFECDETDD